MPTATRHKYALVADELATRIESGLIAVGERLPTEQDLMRRFQVSRHTVRHALDELRRRGVIESRQGRGSSVVKRGSAPVYSETVESVEELLRFATQSVLHLSDPRLVIVDEDLADYLSVAEGRELLEVRSRRTRAGAGKTDILSIGQLWFDGLYSSAALSSTDVSDSVADRIARRFGFEIAEVRQSVSAVVLGETDAAALEAETGSAALLILRRYFDGNGEMFLAAESKCPADRYAVDSVFRRA